MEVKEQILYDSRVRQQVENLRTFVDLKINRDEALLELEEKADKHEMKALYNELSSSIKEILFSMAPNQHGAASPRAGQLPRYLISISFEHSFLYVMIALTKIGA